MENLCCHILIEQPKNIFYFLIYKQKRLGIIREKFSFNIRVLRGREGELEKREKHGEGKRRLREKRIVRNQIKVEEANLVFFYCFLIVCLMNET